MSDQVNFLVLDISFLPEKNKPMNPIIEIKNIGKKYNITHQRGGYIALRDVLMNVIKSPFSFLKTKARQVIGFEKKEEFWALKDVNFAVQKGETIGIIGSNGAGKSTLLKILSQITPPTEGEIVMHGKVASLLEVGTGFHPELTGRENIFLNGAILGMKKKEIAKKFDEIVEFAGIEKFLDTPVKYYSSGMYVRLAFSVAAHMEPDILLVDEVLAVGDADFQKKCLGKMGEVTTKDGRTILFISHNMSAIKTLCKRTILLEKGRVVMIGETDDVVAHYLSSSQTDQKATYKFARQDSAASINNLSIFDEEGSARSELSIGENFYIKTEFTCKTKIDNAVLAILFYSPERDLLLYSTDADTTGKSNSYAEGSYSATVEVPAFLFNVGRHSFDVMLCTPNVETYGEQKGLGFEIVNTNNPRSGLFWRNHPGKTAVHLPYKIHKEK
jgi:lipopolysaccharide transport system ATP-binding protein